MNLSGKIIGLYVGKVEERWPDKAPSAIAKTYTDGPLELDENGFLRDEQADLKVHGGPEKAIHHYASDHMGFWQKEHPEQVELFVPGCFGENIATTGLTEENLCLGDILSLGTAKVQVCQGRQPCWKLTKHIGIRNFALQFQQTALTGWYYRVLENGQVKVGDTMELLERPCPDWSIKRLIEARFNSKIDADTAQELANLDVLSTSWRTAFEKKAQKGYAEDTGPRLKG